MRCSLQSIPTSTIEDQTIYFPEIKTTAKDADTNSNISCAKEEITLVDTFL